MQLVFFTEAPGEKQSRVCGGPSAPWQHANDRNEGDLAYVIKIRFLLICHIKDSVVQV